MMLCESFAGLWMVNTLKGTFSDRAQPCNILRSWSISYINIGWSLIVGLVRDIITYTCAKLGSKAACNQSTKELYYNCVLYYNVHFNFVTADIVTV